jgi:virulence-associated protein VapD
MVGRSGPFIRAVPMYGSSNPLLPDHPDWNRGSGIVYIGDNGMSKITPLNRLQDQAAKLQNTSKNLELTVKVCKELKSEDREKVTCAFSDIFNAVETHLATIKNTINITKRHLNTAHSYTDKSVMDIMDIRATLQRIYAQMTDFWCLMDCQIEECQNSPRIYAGYFSARLDEFSKQLWVSASDLTRVAR